MGTFIQDLKYAARTLVKRPAFAFIAVLTLALGIGANTAIFSVVSSTLLAPLPFASPERTVVVWASNPELARAVGLPDRLPVGSGTFFLDWQQAKSFDKLALVGSDGMTLTGAGEPEQLDVVNVTGEFFQALGAKPLLGRTLQPGDDEGSTATTAVLSQSLWQSRFGGDPKVVGSKIVLDGNPVTVVGVMPAAFAFPRGGELPAGFGFRPVVDAWVPMAMTQEDRQNRGNHNAVAIGSLAAGVGIEAAQAEMEAISDRLAQAYPEQETGWRARVEPLPEVIVGDVKPSLLILLGAVALVLLIACANVANLLLAQATARQKEVAIRTALGAGRGRMVRQLLTESALLSLAGGGLGLLAAYWGMRGFEVWMPAGLGLTAPDGLDGRVLAFTLAVTLATGAVAGLVPAFQMTRPDLASTLRDGTRTGGGTARGGRTRRALVVVETALAVLLVVGAGLLLRSFARLSAVDPGFQPANALVLTVSLPESKYKEDLAVNAFTDRLVERLGGLPGVTKAGAVSNLPLGGGENINFITIEGRPEPEPGKEPLADTRTATPGYFEALGIPLRRGRLLTAQDTAEAPGAAVIDEMLARAYWPGEEALGKRLHFGGSAEKERSWFTVVGVVGNVRHSGLHVEARPQLYVSQARSPRNVMTYVVRTAGDPPSLAQEARNAVFAVDRDQPVSSIDTMEQVVSRSLASRRFSMVLLGVFAGLALVLAAVGIYGITSYSVAQRTREMGLRMALGAEPGTVLRMVLREAGTLALVGLATGLLLALAATRVMASLLFGVGSTDPATFAAVAIALALVSLTAAYLPGRRATRVDPMVALRAE